MGSDLGILVRLARAEVDDCRRRVAGLMQKTDEIENMINIVERDLAREQAAAQALSPDMGTVYAAYAASMIVRRRDLRDRLRTSEADVAAALEELTVSYRHLKSLELTHEARERQRAIAAARAEQQRLDELAKDRFRRERT